MVEKNKALQILKLIESEGIKNSLNNKKLTQECFTTYLPTFTKNIDGPFLDIGTDEAKLLVSLLIEGTNMATTVKK